MGLEKREARSHRAHRPATPRSSFRDRRTGTPPAPRDTGKGPLILRAPETRLHPPRLRLIPGQPPKIYFRLSIVVSCGPGRIGIGQGGPPDPRRQGCAAVNPQRGLLDPGLLDWLDL